jgi:large conductance mechanosensitive channel
MAKQRVQSEGEKVTIVDDHGRHHHGVAVILDSDDVVRDQFGGFMEFLRDYAVVGLAVGFIIGQQAQSLIKQLVDSFVQPVLDIFIGSHLQTRAFSISLGDNHAHVTWGKFVYILLDFIFVMIFIYATVKLLKLDKLVAKKKK